MEETEEIISEGAHPKETKPKPIPFVIYTENERIVLGSAVLKENGIVDVTMNSPIDSRAEDILSVIDGEFKFGLPRRIRTYLPEIDNMILREPAELIISPEHKYMNPEPIIAPHEYPSGGTASDGAVPH